MRREDISLALHILGYYIEQKEKEGFNPDFVLQLKHAWLRIHWWTLKNPLYSHLPALTEEELQEIVEKGLTISPIWLPCRKLLSEGRGQPCTSLDKTCRCAQLLQCEQGEEACSSS